VAAATVAAALVPVLELAVCVAAAAPTSAAGGYTVTATTEVGGGPDAVAVDPVAKTAYVTNLDAGTLTQTITRTPTALTERIRLSPQQAITVTATLTSSGRPVSGQPVSFGTGPTQLCTPDTSTTGVATCVLTGPQALLAEHDTDAIRARYPGSTGYRPSSTAAVPPPLP
jgi:DNA-binding beta-propeller fold protein YncE